MPNAFKPLLVILAVALILGGVIYIGPKLSSEEHIPWRTDLAKSREEAASQHKEILAYFTADWCGPCQQMKRTTFADKGVEQTLEAFIPLKLDLDKNKELARQYAVTAIPCFLVLNWNGEILKRTEGAMGTREFRMWLKGQ